MVLPCFRVRENIVAASYTLYSSLIIVKSLQLHGRRQIAESCKYCLVRVIFFFFGVCFLFFILFFLFFIFFVSHRLGIWFNSLQLLHFNVQYVGAQFITGQMRVR